MAKSKTHFVCSSCGYTTSKFLGKCPECNQWGTLNEEKIVETSKQPTGMISNFGSNQSISSLKQMKDVADREHDRIITGINEFDRVVGGGLVKDSITILAAPPGAGKSTLSIMLCDKMIELGYNVLYASGEESETQIKNRAKRLQLKHIDNLYITNNTNLDTLLKQIEDYDIEFMVIDSIQTFYLNDALPSKPGNVTQVNECANALRNVAKNPEKQRAILLIGQMTKDDELAGSRQLEHLVDTYIQIDGEEEDNLRILYAIKNRFGNTGEMGFFNMEETGLISIDNPSEYFMTERDEDVVGTALTVIKEGSRPVIAEIESLVSQSYTPYPSRLGEALKRDQLNILVSILEERSKVNLFNKNVVIKTTGGIKLKEQSTNLAILMSIASSYYDKPIPSSYVFIADVGLTGELKKVPNLEMRVKELNRLNYKKVFIVKDGVKQKKYDNLEVIECKTLLDVIGNVFGDVKRQRKSQTKKNLDE